MNKDVSNEDEAVLRDMVAQYIEYTGMDERVSAAVGATEKEMIDATVELIRAGHIRLVYVEDDDDPDKIWYKIVPTNNTVNRALSALGF